MTAEPTALPDNVARIVMLTYGRMQDGKSSYWCYVGVKPSEYDRFLAILKEGKLNLEKFEEDGFGEVIVSGPGLYPPPQITKQVAKASGAPIQDLFGNADPKSLIARKIEALKKSTEGQG